MNLFFKAKTTTVNIEQLQAIHMSAQIDIDHSFHHEEFQDRLPHHYRTVLSDFRKAAQSFAFFNGSFLGLIALEILTCLCLLPHLHEATFLAFTLSAFFLTIFSYLMLFLYYTQAKKPEQLEELVQRFKATCSSSLRLFPEGSSHHLAVADALFKLSQYLAEEEWQLFPLNDRFPMASRFLARCQARFSRKDTFHFKQLLLQVAIQEYLHQIRLTPTDLELHASLASAYVALSELYKSPEGLDASKHQLYGKLALEEFQILNHYAPNDPWVHEQLASGYRDLGLCQEETREVEFLRKLRPNDGEIAFRLGTLYFKQGLNAKGLQIYEELKKANFSGAEQVMGTYGKMIDT